MHLLVRSSYDLETILLVPVLFHKNVYVCAKSANLLGSILKLNSVYYGCPFP